VTVHVLYGEVGHRAAHRAVAVLRPEKELAPRQHLVAKIAQFRPSAGNVTPNTVQETVWWSRIVTGPRAPNHAGMAYKLESVTFLVLNLAGQNVRVLGSPTFLGLATNSLVLLMHFLAIGGLGKNVVDRAIMVCRAACALAWSQGSAVSRVQPLSKKGSAILTFVPEIATMAVGEPGMHVQSRAAPVTRFARVRGLRQVAVASLAAPTRSSKVVTFTCALLTVWYIRSTIGLHARSLVAVALSHGHGLLSCRTLVESTVRILRKHKPVGSPAALRMEY
jgi:hypothetical protein